MLPPTVEQLRQAYLDQVVACGYAVVDEKFMRAVEMSGSNPIHEMAAADFRRSYMAQISKAVSKGQSPSWGTPHHLEQKLIAYQCRLLANSLTVAPELFTDTARSIATTARDTGDYATGPILADACQDPGDIPEMVCDHLRHSAGPHRCHVMDYIAYPKKENVK